MVVIVCELSLMLWILKHSPTMIYLPLNEDHFFRLKIEDCLLILMVTHIILGVLQSYTRRYELLN